MLVRLEHARLNQRNGEETIERRYRQYLRIGTTNAIHYWSRASAHQVVPTTQMRNAESVRHTAVREN